MENLKIKFFEQVVVESTGEIVEGVEVIERAPEFKVEVK